MHDTFFDTVTLRVPGRAEAIAEAARARRINLRVVDADTLGITLDETTTARDGRSRCGRRSAWRPRSPTSTPRSTTRIPSALRRRAEVLAHPIFHRYRSETQMLRYLRRLADRDVALDRSMIPLGSCTMKLNSTTEMLPVTWPEFASIHPFAPIEQAAGYVELIRRPRAHAHRDHRLRRGVAATQRRLAGRVRGAPRDPQVPRASGATRTARSA